MKLGVFPTAIESRDFPGAIRLWIKREDRSGELYGGNKVRRLEYLFDAARAKQKTRLVTLGAVGSHHVLATTLYGEREGFAVEAYLVAQPDSKHARDNIRCALAHGLVAHATHAALLPRVRFGLPKDAYYIPLGGSSVESTAAAVTLVDEVAADVARGILPAPDWIVTASGSGGTAAALAVGIAKHGLETNVLAVAISAPAFALAFQARQLAYRAARALGLSRAAPIQVDATQLGKGYGHATEEGARAADVAHAAGLELDPTYTQKSFAAALALKRLEPKSEVLFLHTLSTVDKPPKRSEEEANLPPHLERLLILPTSRRDP